jgi:hypothetical protein
LQIIDRKGRELNATATGGHRLGESGESDELLHR